MPSLLSQRRRTVAARLPLLLFRHCCCGVAFAAAATIASSEPGNCPRRAPARKAVAAGKTAVSLADLRCCISGAAVETSSLLRRRLHRSLATARGRGLPACSDPGCSRRALSFEPGNRPRRAPTQTAIAAGIPLVCSLCRTQRFESNHAQKCTN